MQLSSVCKTSSSQACRLTSSRPPGIASSNLIIRERKLTALTRLCSACHLHLWLPSAQERIRRAETFFLSKIVDVNASSHLCSSIAWASVRVVSAELGCICHHHDCLGHACT